MSDELGMDSTSVWELEMEKEDNSKYDLAKLLSINAFVHDDEGYRIKDPNAGEVTVLCDDEANGSIMHYKAEGEHVDPRKVLVLRDSFGIELAPYIADRFSETWLVHRSHYQEMLSEKDPQIEEWVRDGDLVIYEISERYLSELLWLHIE